MMDIKEVTSQEFNDKYTYDGELGAIYTKTGTTFRLWSPLARKVNLYLYDKSHKSKAFEKFKMEQVGRGVWEYHVSEDLHGVYYTYEVEFADRKYHLVDPYAKACGVNGERGMVVDLEVTNPTGWDEDVKPAFINMTDAIIYETHIRDFTIHKSSGVQNKGKYLGLTETGTRSFEGLTTGLDHLVELGVTHVHLMPVIDFDDIDEQNLDQLQYSWGYNPINFNSLEGSYSLNPLDGTQRIKEFKTLVKTLHENGLRVIVDVVYSYSRNLEKSNLHKTFPNYFYRVNDNKPEHELATERKMVRKFIVDSVTYLAKEFHLDGFCFDAMALMDVETMNAVRDALDQIDSSILVYGMGWVPNKSLLNSNLQVSKSNLEQMPRIAIFNDEGREGIKGPRLYPTQPGFVNGGIEMEENVKFTVVAATEHPQVNYENVLYSKKPWAKQPQQTINFASQHHDFTIYDKIAETTEGLDMDARIKMAMMANAIVLTSQGIPFIQSGEEMLRTKNGDSFSYKSPDMINQIDWNSKYDHEEIFKYYQGLIALRKAHPAFRMTSTEMIQNHISFVEPTVSNTLAYHIKNNANNDEFTDIFVVHNANTSEVKFKLPHFGVWNIIVEGDQAGTEVLRKITSDEIVVPELTTTILYSNEKMVNEVTIVNHKKDEDFKRIAKVVAGAVGIYLLLRWRKKRK